MTGTIDKIWADDFTEFRKKVEPFFGKLEELAKKDPELYAHQVLSHGFMEYAGIRGLFDDIKTRVTKEKGSFDSQNPEHGKLYWKYLKQEYLNWARQNNLPEKLLEDGWKEFLND